MVGRRAADTLSSAVLNQNDPAIVAAGLPAYLLIIDGMIAEDPGNASLLAGGARLYALYGSRFEPDADHAVVLAAKARSYGERAICLEHAPACAWAGLSHDAFVAALAELRVRDAGVLYAYAVSWLSHLAATSSDWTAVAELPWVQASLERLLELDERHDGGGAHVYLGILNSLRPPALGGQPDIAKAHFERSIELSGGTDLSAKVEYARRYARMMFDQELHDRLLREVLAAPVESPGRTLFNVMAKRDAAQLLETSTEYF
ncbi:MAG TPA: TRAP transporter TatT component family protein [Gammaproteobacteria bacterium]|nr:TRAP transporter TatT component family protein [Gammaproteobacteria bacterium]